MYFSITFSLILRHVSVPGTSNFPASYVSFHVVLTVVGGIHHPLQIPTACQKIVSNMQLCFQSGYLIS